MRKLIFAATTLVFASACTMPAGSVRGFQAPGGGNWSVFAENRAVAPGTLVDLAPSGSSSYVGASSDGSVIAFLHSDGVIRFYRSR